MNPSAMKGMALNTNIGVKWHAVRNVCGIIRIN